MAAPWIYHTGCTAALLPTHTWYHSLLTPPASMPSSPTNVTLSLPRISAADLLRSLLKLSSNTVARLTARRRLPA